MQNENNDVIEIDLMEVLGLLWHRLWLIALCTLAGGAVAFGISKFVLTEQFQSTTRVYVLNKQNENTLTYSDVQLGTQLTKDFREIIKSRYVLERVAATCGLEGGTGGLASRISVDTQSDTRIITITVTDKDPAMAQYLADEVRKEAADRIKSVMDIEAVNVVDEANLPASPSSPKVGRWTLAGAALGAVLCAAVILILYMLDDTIKTSDDIEKYLGLSTLGMIPIREDEEKQKNRKKKKRRKSGERTTVSRGSIHADRGTAKRDWAEEEDDGTQPAGEQIDEPLEDRITNRRGSTNGKPENRGLEGEGAVNGIEADGNGDGRINTARGADTGTEAGSRTADRTGSGRTRAGRETSGGNTTAADRGDRTVIEQDHSGRSALDRNSSEKEESRRSAGNRAAGKKEPVQRVAAPEKRGMLEGRGGTDRKMATGNLTEFMDTYLAEEAGDGEEWRDTANRRNGDAENRIKP